MLGSDDIQFERECAVQQDCSGYATNDPRLCREGRCIRLLDDFPDTEEREGGCYQILGRENLKSSSYPPFVFGALARFDEDPTWINPMSMNYNLVVRDFSAQGGLDIRGTTHLPVIVVCDPLLGDKSLDRSFDHLTEHLGVTGILAPLGPSELKRSFERLHRNLQRDVFMLSPFGSDWLLENTVDDGLLWHLQGPPVGIGPLYVPLIRRVEQYMKAYDDRAARAPIRVALVATDAALNGGLSDYVDEHLIVNGKDAKANGPEYYRRILADDPARVLHDLLAFRPHLVIVLADESTMINAVIPFEAAWEQIAPGEPSPFYVFGHQQMGTSSLLMILEARGGDLRKRLVGTGPAGARDTRLYDSYLRELGADNPHEYYIENIENYYDAAYFLMYAAVAAKPGPGLPNGWELAEGMARLVSGPPFDVGAANIPSATAWLRQSTENTLSLVGTLGEPDFDVETGTRRTSEGAVWCVAKDAAGVLSYRYNALRLNAEGDELEGDFGCFEDF